MSSSSTQTTATDHVRINTTLRLTVILPIIFIIHKSCSLITLFLSFFACLSCFCLHVFSYPILIYSTVSWDNLRIPGVLQRLAFSYLVVACLDLLVARGRLDILTTVSKQLHLPLFFNFLVSAQLVQKLSKNKTAVFALKI